MGGDLRALLVAGSAGMGVSLDDAAIDRLFSYLALLQEWGSRINLTSRLEAREIVVYHFLDSLSGLPWLAGTPDARVVDIGAGAGFPGIPLAMALPRLAMTLVESSRKKTAFCSEVIRSTRLEGSRAVWGRAEEIGRTAQHAGKYGWAVTRAVGQAGAMLDLALPFLAPGGKLLLYKGAPSSEELEGLDLACRRAGAAWVSHAVAVPHLEGARTHIIVTKGSTSPA